MSLDHARFRVRPMAPWKLNSMFPFPITEICMLLLIGPARLTGPLRRALAGHDELLPRSGADAGVGTRKEPAGSTAVHLGRSLSILEYSRF